MELIIVLRKEVPDDITAETIINQLKAKLVDFPDVKMQAQTTKRYPTES